MKYEIHPVANLFPLIEGRDFEQLVADIKENGLLVPIEYQGNTILDGRNRLRACEAAGVVPQYKEIPESVNATKYIISLNAHRRHLTTQQRAAIAAELATMEHGGDRKSEKIKGSNDPLNSVSIDQAAELMSVSAPSVKRAKARMKTDPAAHEAAKLGKKPPKTTTAEGNDMGNPIHPKRKGWMFWKQAVQAQFIEDSGVTIGDTRLSDVKNHLINKVDWFKDFELRSHLSPKQAEEIKRATHDFIIERGLIEQPTDIKPSVYQSIDEAESDARSITANIEQHETSKLQRAIKAHEKLLDLKFEQRVKEHMDEILAMYSQEYNRYKSFNDAYSGVFSDDEYRLLISVLHPDRCPPDRAQQFAKAFHLIKSKEEVLCKVKQSDRPNTMPSTLEELMARRRRH